MRKLFLSAAAVAATLLPLGAAAAQSLAQRVAGVREGDVELHYAARAGACGDGRYVISLGRSMRFAQGGSRDSEYGMTCLPGPVRVRLHVTDGSVSDVRTFVGPLRSTTTAPTTDLGAVPAREAAEYFLQLAATASSRTSDRAILPAVLADSASVWRALLRVAGDSGTRSRGTRTNAAFWLSRFASVKLEGHGEDLAGDEADEDPERDDARSSAVFALSQLRDREGIPPLVQVARTNKNAHLRRQALFWLGQSGDARALALFEEILTQ